jgi:hypothetical protein
VRFFAVLRMTEKQGVPESHTVIYRRIETTYGYLASGRSPLSPKSLPPTWLDISIWIAGNHLAERDRVRRRGAFDFFNGVLPDPVRVKKNGSQLKATVAHC